MSIAKKLLSIESPEPPPSVLYVEMTAGTAFNLIGYANNYLAIISFGSITGEPIVGEVLDIIFTTGTGGLAATFSGDILSEVSGKSLYVDSVEYAGGWYLSSGTTLFEITAGGPTFVIGVTYEIGFA